MRIQSIQLNTGLLMLVLLLIIGSMQSAYAVLTGPGSAWQYCRRITMSPVTPAADYQVKVTLIAGQYTHMNASGNDLRFYDVNNNLCNYWIETWNTSGTSTIWVKAPVAGTADLYLFYGNASAPAAASGPSTFEYFDDGSTLSGWTNVSATVDGTRGQPAPSLKAIANQYAYRNIGLTTNKILEYSNYVISGTPLCNLFFLANSSGAGQMFRLESRASNSPGFATTTSWVLWGTPAGFNPVTAGAWHSVKIVLKATTADGFIDGVAFGSNFTLANNGGYIAVHGDGPTVTGGNFDNIRIRQYAASEPLSGIGSEGTNNLTASITAQTNVLCNGQSTGSATVTASGGSSPYSYLWSNAQTNQIATGLSATAYTVTVTDNIGLTATATATITQPTALTTTINGQSNVTCYGRSDGTITILASGGTSPYQFSHDNGTTYTTGSNPNPYTFTGLSANTAYKIRVIDSNNCQSIQIP